MVSPPIFANEDHEGLGPSSADAHAETGNGAVDVNFCPVEGRQFGEAHYRLRNNRAMMVRLGPLYATGRNKSDQHQHLKARMVRNMAPEIYYALKPE